MGAAAERSRHVLLQPLPDTPYVRLDAAAEGRKPLVGCNSDGARRGGDGLPELREVDPEPEPPKRVAGGSLTDTN
jgi:hypothetical protein